MWTCVEGSAMSQDGGFFVDESSLLVDDALNDRRSGQ